MTTRIISYNTLFTFWFFLTIPFSVAADDTFKFTLLYADPKSEFSEVYLYDPEEGFINLLDKESNGRIKITTVYYAGQLIADAEVYDAAVRGTVDISINSAHLSAGRFPVFDLVGVSSIDSNCLRPSAAVMDLWRQFPEEYERGFDGVKLLATMHTVATPPGLPLATTKKPVQRLEDFEGLRITGPGKFNVELLKAFGASMVLMPVFEQYASLQKGIIDAVILDPVFYDMISLKEVMRYQTNISFSGYPWYIVMNQNKWNKLPEDIQDIFMRAAENVGYLMDSFGRSKKSSIVKSAVENYGLELIDLSEKEMARLKAIEGPLIEKHISKYEKNGIPAREIWNAWLKLRVKYSAY
jgi:TRAP-type C4-dicarboxylate transport system substrate-binding protein